MAEKKAGKVEVSLADEEIEIIHNVGDTPATFIDGAQGFAIINGLAKMHVYQLVQSFDKGAKESTIKKVVVGQLIMTPPVLMSVAKWLSERAQDVEADLAALAGKSADGKK